MAECCDPDTISPPYNPYTDGEASTSEHAHSFNFARLRNPVVDEITDTESIREFFKDFPYVPYAGTNAYSAHTFLAWLFKLRQTSPTLGACLSSIGRYVFSDKLDINEFKHVDFLTGEDDLDESKVNDYLNFITDNIDYGYESMMTLLRKIYEYYKPTGNTYLQLNLVEFKGQKKAGLYLHNPLHCLYVATAPGQPKVVGISPQWDKEFIEKHPPVHIPVYPHYKESDGVKTTLIHLKNGINEWYGYPDWVSCFMYAYRELQDATYLIKQADNNFIGQLIIEVEGGDDQFSDFAGDADKEAQDAGFDNVADRIEQNFTVKGDDPSSVMVMERPFATKPMEVFQTKPNTNHEFYRASHTINSNMIIRANNWSQHLLDGTAPTGLSNNVYVNDLTTKELGVISDIRRIIVSPLNIALKEISIFFGKSEYQYFGITFPSLLEKIANENLDDSVGSDFK